MKDQRIEKAQAIEIARRAVRRAAIQLAGSIGTIVLGVGLVLFSGFGNLLLVIVGFLLLPFGAWLLANVVMGGLGTGAWNRWTRRPRKPLSFRNPEEMREKEGVREERKKEEFD